MPIRLRLALLLLIPAAAVALAPTLGALAGVMLALITLIALVIDRYADRYLAGQAGRTHFQRWFVATVAAVSLLVVAPDLRLMAVAWTASSLSLHQLLTFFAERPQAQVTAHKKFLLSRLADVAIYAAVFLLGRAFGTFEIDLLLARATSLPAGAVLPVGAVVAGYLVVGGIVLRTAQLPFHGWLIQVMEAPTPVSALLHAGVVNIGGFVLLRLAPLIGLMHGARSVLVIIGATTAVLAALTAQTRGSVKNSLAWSTASQMGFMLVECGLGAWELALLHLVAHSLYKAHAFLRSGNVVAAHAARPVDAGEHARGVVQWIVGLVVGWVLARQTVATIWPAATGGDATARVALLMLTLALAPVLAGLSPRGGWRPAIVRLGAAVLTCVALVASHAVLRSAAPITTPPATGLLVFAFSSFATLFAIQLMIDLRPASALAVRLYPHALAGFHLDALFTRATFLLWPPRVVRRQRASFPSAQVSNRRAA